MVLLAPGCVRPRISASPWASYEIWDSGQAPVSWHMPKSLPLLHSLPAFLPLTMARGVCGQVGKDQTSQLQILENVGLGPGLREPRGPSSSLVGELPKCAATGSFNDFGACSQTSSALSFILLFIVTCKINNTLDWRLWSWFLLPAKGLGSLLGCEHSKHSMKKLESSSSYPGLQHSFHLAVFTPEACCSLWQPRSELAKASLPFFISEVRGYSSISHYLRVIVFQIHFFKKTSLLKSKNTKAVNCEKLGILKLRNMGC